jgi:hypothetical protein
LESTSDTPQLKNFQVPWKRASKRVKILFDGGEKIFIFFPFFGAWIWWNGVVLFNIPSGVLNFFLESGCLRMQP